DLRIPRGGRRKLLGLIHSVFDEVRLEPRLQQSAAKIVHEDESSLAIGHDGGAGILGTVEYFTGSSGRRKEPWERCIRKRGEGDRQFGSMRPPEPARSARRTCSRSPTARRVCLPP